MTENGCDVYVRVINTCVYLQWPMAIDPSAINVMAIAYSQLTAAIAMCGQVQRTHVHEHVFTFIFHFIIGIAASRFGTRNTLALIDCRRRRRQLHQIDFNYHFVLSKFHCLTIGAVITHFYSFRLFRRAIFSSQSTYCRPH